MFVAFLKTLQPAPPPPTTTELGSISFEWIGDKNCLVQVSELTVGDLNRLAPQLHLFGEPTKPAIVSQHEAQIFLNYVRDTYDDLANASVPPIEFWQKLRTNSISHGLRGLSESPWEWMIATNEEWVFARPSRTNSYYWKIRKPSTIHDAPETALRLYLPDAPKRANARKSSMSEFRIAARNLGESFAVMITLIAILLRGRNCVSDFELINSNPDESHKS